MAAILDELRALRVDLTPKRPLETGVVELTEPAPVPKRKRGRPRKNKAP